MVLVVSHTAAGYEVAGCWTQYQVRSGQWRLTRESNTFIDFTQWLVWHQLYHTPF